MDETILNQIIVDFSKLIKEKDCLLAPYKNIKLLAVRINEKEVHVCPEVPRNFFDLPEWEEIHDFFSELDIEFSPSTKGFEMISTYNLVDGGDSPAMVASNSIKVGSVKAGSVKISIEENSSTETKLNASE